MSALHRLQIIGWIIHIFTNKNEYFDIIKTKTIPVSLFSNISLIELCVSKGHRGNSVGPDTTKFKYEEKENNR